MKLSKRKFSDICAEVSAKNVSDTIETAKRINDENGTEFAHTRLLMDVLCTKFLVKALGFEDENSELEITKETFDEAKNKTIDLASDGMDSADGKFVMTLEAIHFTTLLAKRLFGEETEDEA